VSVHLFGHLFINAWSRTRCFLLLVYCLVYSTLKMETICFSETSVNFRPTTLPYSEPDKFSPHVHSIFLLIHFNIILANYVFSSRFPTIILHVSPWSMCATCANNPIMSSQFSGDVQIMKLFWDPLWYSKVKLSLYRPWRPLGLREVEAPTFSDIRLTEGGNFVSPTRRPLFTETLANPVAVNQDVG
jgi:hypothetical protein